MSRIVIVSHSHPNLRYGGGEVAAYRQFQHLLTLGEDVFFVGSTIGPEDSARFFGPSQQVISFGPRDFCLRGRGMDGFVMEQAEIRDEDWIFEFLLALRGDVYHFHHFWNIGAGTIRRLRAALPDAKFICTLHELTAICANHGQMVKRSGELCYVASEVEAALGAGVPVQGICLYPILNHLGWDDDRYCPNGLFDGVAPDGAREVHPPLAEELARWQSRFAR